MPYPSKLDSETLVSAAFDMIEQGGVEAFSMHKLAAEFGVKTASLYRYFNKEALIQAVKAARKKDDPESRMTTPEGVWS